MGKIKQLDEQLANKIAAGEVVERPSSVVKELVENAIDANSTKIDVEIEEAGLAKIRIVDNGDGIEKDDCSLAFERHATSKIKDENDLFRIRTLGFRGEALPSIASVSTLELKTSTGNGPGTHVVLKGGNIQSNQYANSRKGTEITVTDLFFNTPARLKYLKSIHTELGHITDVMNRMAFSHPEVAFRLIHNGKKLLQTNGNGDLLQVIASVYGIAVAKKMIPVSFKSLDFEVEGYIALPEVTRASRNYVSTIINGRFIKNYPLLKAVQSGYHTLLPIGRFPIALLKVDMDPLLVDVNVHPAKLEVRLSKEQELNQLVENGIKDTFRKQRLIPEFKVKEPKVETPKDEQQTFSFEHKDDARSNGQSTSTLLREKTIPKNEFSSKPDMFDQVMSSRSEDRPVDEETNNLNQETSINEEEKASEVAEAIDELQAEHTDNNNMDKTDRIPPMYPIGQMHGTYIIAQNETGLFLIDQHAAQERIKYEFYREKVGEVQPEVQEMLVPLTLEFSKDECVKIEEHKEELMKVGVFLESFGSQGYIVRSHPSWFPKGEEKETIEEMIEQVLLMKKVDIKKLREEAAITMSCKGSIKANHHLRDDEIFALLETLRKTTDPFTCPHGRPIIVHFSTYEMEKMFKRVM